MTQWLTICTFFTQTFNIMFVTSPAALTYNQVACPGKVEHDAASSKLNPKLLSLSRNHFDNKPDLQKHTYQCYKDLQFYHQGVKAFFGLAMSWVATDLIINLSLSGSIWLAVEFAQPFGEHLAFFVPVWPLMEPVDNFMVYTVNTHGNKTEDIGLLVIVITIINQVLNVKSVYLSLIHRRKSVYHFQQCSYVASAVSLFYSNGCTF